MKILIITIITNSGLQPILEGYLKEKRNARILLNHRNIQCTVKLKILICNHEKIVAKNHDVYATIKKGFIIIIIIRFLKLTIVFS